ncbi:hypothetical protein ACTTZI_004150 [Vibrio vulnificus]
MYHTLSALEDPEFMEQFLKRKAELGAQADRIVRHMVLCTHNGIDLNQKCFLQPEDPNFELPSKSVVNQVVNLLLELNPSWKKDDISRMLGISTSGSNRLLNYWMNEEQQDRSINKSNWFLLVSKSGLLLLDIAKNNKL